MHNRGESLTKEGEREGKERKEKPKERVLYNCVPILYGIEEIRGPAISFPDSTLKKEKV